jgi:hypothetical protein
MIMYGGEQPMGKGARSRKQRTARQHVSRPDPVIAGTLASLSKDLTVRQHVTGWSVLLTYLAYMAEASQEIEYDLAVEQLSDHSLSADDVQARADLEAAKRAIPDEVRYSAQREEAAEAIAAVAPSDLFGAVTAIRLAPLRFGPILTGWPPDTAEWRRGTIPILSALCPPGLLEALVSEPARAYLRLSDAVLAAYGQPVNDPRRTRD